MRHVCQQHAGFCDNSIRTAKYSRYNFVPRNLFEQFRRVANMYFLLLSILMIVGTYWPSLFESPLAPFATFGSLCLVVAATMAKDGYEDYKRHQSDATDNDRPAVVLSSTDEDGGSCAP